MAGERASAAAGAELEQGMRGLIREIPDFPRGGIDFKDITPLLADPSALSAAVRALAELARPLQVDCVIAAEARGFLLGPALALELGAGFVLARKPGKLPYETIAPSTSWSTARTSSSCTPTRSQAARACSCTTTCSRRAARRWRCASWSKQLGGEVVGCGFLVELAFLEGRERLAPRPTHALLELRHLGRGRRRGQESRADRQSQPHDRRCRLRSSGR